MLKMKSKKLIKGYLILFIIYIVLVVSTKLYAGYYISKYGERPYMLYMVGEVASLLFIIFFNSFNIYIFINAIKNKFHNFKKHLLFLPLSEIVYILWFLLIFVLGSVFSIHSSFFVYDFIFYIFKAAQIMGIILVWIKLRKTK